MTRPARPTLAVWKFASCDGCQLTLLNCEDDLLAVADAVEIASFPEASRAVVAGPYDLSLVEGSITTPADAQRIAEVRASSRFLVTIGACATAGGIQALRNLADVAEFTSVVYARPDYIQTLATSTAIADHVPVDFELRGCPIDRRQLLEVIAAFLHGRRPGIRGHSVCIECKRAGLDLRDGRARHAVPGTGDPGRLRRAVPVGQPRLLRLLRADGVAEHGRAGHLAGHARHGPPGTGPGVPHLQHRRARVPDGG